MPDFELCFRDRDKNGAICGYPVGYSEKEEKALLKRHPSWYRSTVEYDKNGMLKK